MSLHNIIIDTDIGDDADDVLALAYTLSSPSINLLGVTTVFRNTKARAQMAMHTLSLANRTDVGVFPGEGHSLNKENDLTAIPCQYQENSMAGYVVSETSAQEFYHQTLSTQSATIVAIGPLTNVARLIATQPDVHKNIERIVLMGGAYYRHANEWNIFCDPEAAQVVFQSGIPLYAVGLDVTVPCELATEQLHIMSKKADTPLKNFLLDSCDAWKQHSGFNPVLHDPLAIHAVLNPQAFEFKPERVNVECQGEVTRGMTVCSDDGIWGRIAENPNVYVAEKCQTHSFIEHFIQQVF